MLEKFILIKKYKVAHVHGKLHMKIENSAFVKLKNIFHFKSKKKITALPKYFWRDGQNRSTVVHDRNLINILIVKLILHTSIHNLSDR